jgi:NADH:ubiquinone oxidoreductase subunit 6 (subunit J)
MEAIENIAMTWCKIKSYIAVVLGVLFTFVVLSSVFTIFTTKDKKKKSNAMGVTLFSSFLILFCILSYYWVRSSVGCGISTAGNLFSLVSR